MKHILILILSIVSINVVAASYPGENPIIGMKQTEADSIKSNLKKRMKIIIGTKTFTATLLDNETVTTMKDMLPLTLDMSDLNKNEKYFHFTDNLPSAPEQIGTIQSGDLMLWQTNSLVLFYRTFSTSYLYTRIGKIDDPSGLALALGTGNSTVKFEVY